MPSSSTGRGEQTESIVTMLTEMVFYLAILLLENRVEAFVLIFLAFVLMSNARRLCDKEELPFMRAVSRDFGRARAVFSRASIASVVVFVSGCLFVAGVLDLWILPVVAGLAVWWVWRARYATRPTQQSDSAPTDSLHKPTVPADKERTCNGAGFRRSTPPLMGTARPYAAKGRRG